MKLKYLIGFVIVLSFNLSNYAQSDFEKVQNFKLRFHQLDSSIKTASALWELDSLTAEILSFKSQFLAEKDLLDKSLYPDNFNKSFEKLNNAVQLRRGDFTQIETLKTEVVVLKDQITELNTKNSDLLSRVRDLEYRATKDKETIAKLEKMIDELKSTLRKRDELIISIVDTLLGSSYNVSQPMNEQTKKDLVKESEKENLLSNVKRAVSENIKFMEVTSLGPDDFSQIKKQQSDYSEMWAKIGPLLVEAYADRNDQAKEIEDINRKLSDWKTTINRQVWNNISRVFAENGIRLSSFFSGGEFTAALSAFISDEIKNIEAKGKDESLKTYAEFADSTWFRTIKSNWVPFLIEYKMLTVEQKDNIEMQIAEWKSELEPSYLWLYILIAVVLIALIIFIFKKRKKSNKEIPAEDLNTPPPGE